MAALLYRHSLIIAMGQHDEAKGTWLSTIDLSWGTGSYRGSHVIHNFSRSFQTKGEAETFGVETGERLRTA